MKISTAIGLATLWLRATSCFIILPEDPQAVPVLSSTNSKEIPNSYLVVFKRHMTKHTAQIHADWVNKIHTTSQPARLELRKRSQSPLNSQQPTGLKHTFEIARTIRGYTGNFDDNTLNLIRHHPDIEYIEADSVVHTLGTETLVQKDAPWGLARLSHREGLTLSNFNKYQYCNKTGKGVDVYVIDTGINTKHVDFEGRAFWAKTIPDGDEDEDGNGHGTHCSGTIAGKQFGVAKAAHLYAIKVLRSNGSGSMSDVLKGVEYAVDMHLKAVDDAASGKRPDFKGSVANMSLGGGRSRTLDLVVDAAVDAGMFFAVAAGNENGDSCRSSPASAKNPITVGASTLFDERASFSNYGKCVDIFAPGLNIQSAWIGSDTATNVISGTSMASPHVAGLMAYMLSLQPAKDSAFAVSAITPEQMKQDLSNISTKDLLTGIDYDTKNLLIWNGGGESNYQNIIKGDDQNTTSTVKSSKLSELAKHDPESVVDNLLHEMKKLETVVNMEIVLEKSIKQLKNLGDQMLELLMHSEDD